MLTYEHMLVHVIVHGAEGNANHRTLRWVVDASYIIERAALDWNRVLVCAQEGGHVVAMQYGIAYLKDRMSINVPSDFIEGLMQLSVSRQQRRDYWRSARIWYPLLGNFPSLWYRYWKFEAVGSFPKRLSLFLPYLKKAWSVSPKESLVRFVCRKYCTRLVRVFRAK